MHISLKNLQYQTYREGIFADKSRLKGVFWKAVSKRKAILRISLTLPSIHAADDDSPRDRLGN